MIYEMYTKTQGKQTIELDDEGEIYINEVKFTALSIHLYDAFITHLAQEKPLSYMKNETCIGYTRRITEAKAAVKSRETSDK